MFSLSYCSEDNRILLNKIYAYPSIWLCIPVLATHLGIFVFVFSTELWFIDVLWPDFGPEHLRDAINDFYGRTRTFGNVPEALAVER